MESSWNPNQEIGSSPTILDYQTVNYVSRGSGFFVASLCDGDVCVTKGKRTMIGGRRAVRALGSTG